MKKFLTRLVVFLLPLAILLFALDYVVTQGLKKTEFGDFATWNNLFEGKINADLIISGSSLAQYQISPKIVDEKTGCNSYNLGMGGSSFNLQYYRYLAFEKRNKKPKVIIQTIDSNTLDMAPILFYYHQVLPYINDELVGDAVLKYKNLGQKDKLIPFYRYIGEYKLIAVGFEEFFNIKHFPDETYKGFITRFGEGEFTEPEELKNIVLKIDNETLKLFEAFLKHCRETGIKLILVNTPIYIETQTNITNSEEISATIQKLAEKYNTDYLDYSDHQMSYQKDFFRDGAHLNHKGVELFSNILTNDLNSKFDLSACKNDVNQ